MKKGENFNHPTKGSTIRVEPIKSVESIERVENLLANHPRNHALFILGTNTSFRPSELINIRVGEVKGLEPMDTLEVKEARTGRVRTITLNDACIESIRQLIRSLKEKKGKDLDPRDLLFQVRQGRLSVQYLNKLVKKWCAKTGLKTNHGSHTLRKTYGYRRLIHDGEDLDEIMESLGHSSPKQTLEYLIVSPEEYQRIMNEHSKNCQTCTNGTSMQRLKMLESENTRLKQRIENLMEEDARLKIIFDNANDQIVYTDLHGTILETNKKGQEMFGHPIKEIVGRKFQDLKSISQEDMEWFIRTFDVAKTGNRSPFREYRLTRKDGSTAVAESSTNPVKKNGEITGFVSIIRDITDRKIAEEELAKYRNHLEDLVKDRTDELHYINKELKQENSSRRKAEKELLKAHDELEQKVEERTANLEEANAALRVLLKTRDEDKNEFEERMMASVKALVLPFLEKLKNSGLKDTQKEVADIIEYNLNDIVSPFARELTSKYLDLTPAEINISNLIKQGKSTKEIADILYMSPRTIDTHRFHIRKKLGINNKRANLQTHLLSLE